MSETVEIEWLREAADQRGRDVTIELHPMGVRITAIEITGHGGDRRATRIIGWAELSDCHANPLPQEIQAVRSAINQEHTNG